MFTVVVALQPMIVLLILIFLASTIFATCGSQNDPNPKAGLRVYLPVVIDKSSDDTGIVLDIISRSGGVVRFTSISLKRNTACTYFDGDNIDYYQLPGFPTGNIEQLALRSTRSDIICLDWFRVFYSSGSLETFDAYNLLMYTSHDQFYWPESCIRVSTITGKPQCWNMRKNFLAYAADDCLCPPGKVKNSYKCDLCPYGSFSNIYDSSCSNCDSGKFSFPDRSGCIRNCASGRYFNPNLYLCDKCLAGKKSDTVVGSTLCIDCDAGKYSPEESSQCLSCASGFYSNQSRSGFCLKCSAGKKSDSVSDSTSCIDCDTGKYSLGESSQCFSCASGFYSNQSLASSCSPCLQGYYSVDGKFCRNCPRGTFSSIPSDQCNDCERGKYSTGGAVECISCPKSTFANNTRSSTCFDCPELRVTLSGGTESLSDCRYCVPGYYGSRNVLDPCKKCQESPGVKCSGFTQLPDVDKGFYRDSENEVFPCYPADSCISTGTEIYTTCSDPYGGFLCGACRTGYYRNELECKPCPANWSKSLIIVCFVILVVFFLVRFVQSKFFISRDMRIALQAIQLIGLFGSFSTKWPQALMNLFAILSFTNFNLELTSPECTFPIDFWDKYFIKMIFPLILMFGMVICDFLRYQYQIRIKKEAIAISFRTLFKNVVPLFSTVVVFMSTYLTSTAISPFNCVKASSTTYVLWKNPSEICFRGTWNEYIFFAGTFTIVYLLFVPSSILFVFVKYRKHVADPVFLKKFGSLVNPYKPRYYYWELVMLLKRIAFISVRDIVFIAFDNQTKFVLSITILAFFLSLEIYFEPYLTKKSNLENISWNIIMISMLICHVYIFENPYDSNVFVSFGVFLLIMFIVCGLFSFYTMWKNGIGGKMSTLLVTEKLARQLPPEILKELCILHSAFEMEKNHLLQVDSKLSPELAQLRQKSNLEIQKPQIVSRPRASIMF